VIAPIRTSLRRPPGALLARAFAILVAIAICSTASASGNGTTVFRPFLEGHPVWRVSGDPTWRPYSFRGTDGKVAGLDVEFSRLLADRIGVRVEWVDVPSWTEALRQFHAGEIDLLMGTAATAERQREMLFTAPYAASPVAVIARIDSPFLLTMHDLSGRAIGAPADHVTTDYVGKMHAGIRLVTYPDLETTLRAVSDGRVDTAVAGLVPAATTIRTLELDGLKVAGIVDARFDLRVAVRRDWPLARDMLDAAIAADPPEVRVERFDRWLQPIMGLQRQAWRWRTWFLVGVAIAAALALGMLVVGIWNRVLRERVARATAAIRTEMAARAESETRFRTMFDQAPLGMYRSTPDGTFLSVNPFLARLFEYESPERMVTEVNCAGIAETLFEDPSVRKRLVASVVDRSGSLGVTQVRYRSRTGKPIEALLSMTAIDDPVSHERTLLGFVQDVTDRAREEATRQRREKLFAMGQMAGGVVHDFKNLLVVVLAEAEYLASQRPADAMVTQSSRRIVEAAHGARGVTDRLLRFVHARGAEKPTSFDGHEVVRATLALFKTASGRRVRVAEDLGAAVTRVAGFPDDLQSAVLNLCLNSRDAMPGGGTITVRTRDAKLSAADCGALAPYAPKPGAYLEIEVSDTGTGMPPDVLATCREPFFTTKGDVGTGLGLWMAHCVVSGLGGAMRIASSPGAGTTVTLDVPVAPAGDARGAERRATAPAVTA
jgi:PAS domain S-box-containing protein